jgi:plasmid stabilization system protein ParE
VTYKVLLTREARDDLQRLEEFLERAAMESGDFDLPLRAVDAILAEFGILERNPFTCRRASEDPFERELVIPFGKAGYVALFRVLSDEEVAVLALRHQREDDYR